jgi:glutamate-1-semialdehyde 2,1-aminomutase
MSHSVGGRDFCQADEFPVSVLEPEAAVASSFNTNMAGFITQPASKPERYFAAEQREASLLSKTEGSKTRWQRACRSLAGGVSSGLRRTARPHPLYFESGSGPRLLDVDGNSYLDYTLAWGPEILGHAPGNISDAIATAAARGLTFGAQHDLEYEVAERLVDIIPCADQVCFANSGTEIVQVALRLARAVTGRTQFIKFEGHYHGWDDSVLVSYHPTQQQMEAAEGAAVGVGLGQLSGGEAVVVRWNDRASVQTAFAGHPGAISAIICEPLLCNSGCIPAEPGFLEFLRDITRREGALLIFDEVITGFRLALGGAQKFYGVTPDLATYAKAVGGGVPLSVLAGKHEFMNYIADGRVVHAGTLNGNPIALSAAKCVLEYLSQDDGSVYHDLHRRGGVLRNGLQAMFSARGYRVITCGEGPVFSLLFLEKPPREYRDLLQTDNHLGGDFALAMLDEGVMLLPDGRWYLSTAHTDADIEATLAAAERVIGGE